MKTNYAQFETREAWLSSEFGESFARRIFGDDVINNLPRNKKGVRKGQLKGKIAWKKCIKGGWVKTGFYDHDAMCGQGYVQSPNVVTWIQLYDPYESFDAIEWNPQNVSVV